MNAIAAEKVETLNVCLGTYPHTRALKKGDVKSERVVLNFTEIDPINKAFRMMAREQKFDVSEMAIVSYLQAKAYGKPLVLMPATMLGRFQHGAMLYNSERGTVRPQDLPGRRVGVRAFTQTTGVWLRGILSKDYGLDLGKVQWVTFEDAHLAEYSDPPGVERVTGKDMTKMLLEGELDAAIYGGVMPTDPRLKSVIADPETAGERLVPEARHRAGQSHGRAQRRPVKVESERGARAFPHAARQQEGGRPAEGRRHRLNPVRLRRGQPGARSHQQLCARDEDHSTPLFGRGIIR